MLHTVLSHLGWFVLLTVLQVLVFNHIHIFGYATPLPYIYALLILPSATPRWLYITAGFLTGLIVDLFTNTPGMAASAGSLTGLLAPLWLRFFRPTDNDEEHFSPSVRTMEWSGFLKYTFFAVFFHCLSFFLLESFTLFHLQKLLLNIAGSTLLTTLIIAAFEAIRKR